MSAIRRALSTSQTRLQTAFWKSAAGATGFAVHHPRVMRYLPIGLTALAAFALGRAAGIWISAF